MLEYLDSILIVVILVIIVIACFVQIAKNIKTLNNKLREEIIAQLASENHFLREEMEAKFDRLRSSHMQMFEAGRDSQRKALSELSKEMQDGLHSFLGHTTSNLEKIRDSVDKRVGSMQASNEKKLDEMKFIVH